jgi:hypothetical protein
MLASLRTKEITHPVVVAGEASLLRNSRKTDSAWPPEFLTLYWRHTVPFALLTINSHATYRIDNGVIRHGFLLSFSRGLGS